MQRVGIVGASGYAGAELLRLCAGHPGFEVAWATGETTAGSPVAGLYPSLAPAFGSMAFSAFDPSLAAEVDLVFCALPHGQSQRLVPGLLEAGCAVVDLAADFRLTDPASGASPTGSRS
jgi:N-acetyl-gamma-glutamyl-phosphate reductase